MLRRRERIKHEYPPKRIRTWIGYGVKIQLERGDGYCPGGSVVEEKLKELTSNLGIDRVNSNIYAHYRHKQDYYIPARLEAFGKMEHHTELMEAMKLLNVCKSLEAYTVNLLCRINENQKKEKKRQYDEWMAKLDGLTSKAGHDTQMAEVLKPLRELIGMVYGDEKLSGNAWQVK